MDPLHGAGVSPLSAFPAGVGARLPSILASEPFAFGFWWYDVQQGEGAV